jgi:hypothetical protein
MRLTSTAGYAVRTLCHLAGKPRSPVASYVVAIPERLSDQPDAGFVDQGSGLNGLARRLLSHLLHSQPAQLVVDQGQELFGDVGIALLQRGQDACHFVHGRHREAQKRGSKWRRQEYTG